MITRTSIPIRRLYLFPFLLFSIWCVSAAGASSSDREEMARAYFQQRVTTESGKAFTPQSFGKTNGYERDSRIYVLEWKAQIRVENDVWKPGDAIGGYWNSFAALPQEPQGLDRLLTGSPIHLERGCSVRLTGDCNFRKTDNGWRVESLDIRTYQVIADKPKSNPASPFAGNWKVDDQEFLLITEMDSGGFRLVERSYSPHAATEDGLIPIDRGYLVMTAGKLEGPFPNTGGRMILTIMSDGHLQFTIDDKFGARSKKAVRVSLQPQ